MSLFKSEDKVSIPRDEYIKQQIELENMKYRLVMAQEYIVSHKIINRETVGTMLGISANMLKGEN